MKVLHNNRIHPTQPLQIASKRRSSQLTPNSIKTVYNAMQRQKDRKKDAQNSLDAGVNALLKGRLDEAETYFMCAARLGDPSGLLPLGIEYEMGRLENRDLFRARYLYMRAMSYYYMYCDTKEELEANTVSIVPQIEQVTKKIETKEAHSSHMLCPG